MSRDLRVIGSEAFAVDQLADWLAGLGRWETTTDGDLTWVHRVMQRGSEPAFSLDGPLRVDAEDLPSPLATAVLTPRWLVEISAPEGTSDLVWKMANRVGRRLANEMEGVLFDPQHDQIAWPRSRQRRKVHLGGVLENTVEFQWAIPARSFTDDLTVEFLNVLRRYLPEALPRRYGTFEPLQHRLEDGEERFHALWREEADSAIGMMFWKATRPVRDGSLSAPSLRSSGDGLPAGSIRIGIDARVFGDSRWRELAITLLDRIGALTNAFSGRAIVEKHWPGGIPATELNNRPLPLAWGGAWHGLPDHPTWLTWLSPAYADAIDRSAYAGPVRATSNGSIVALSDEPRPAAGLLPWSYRFPIEYCRLPQSPPANRDAFVERLDSPPQVAVNIPFAAGE